MSKIDTQGMSGPVDPNVKPTGPVEYNPMMVRPRRLLEDTFVKEMKILINEILDEREGKMDYQSYFDPEGREYPVQ